MRRTFPLAALAALAAVAAGLAVATPAASQVGGQAAYAVRSDGDDQLYRIDLATGAATAIGPTGFGEVESLAFGPDGTLYGVDDITDQLITLDLSSGAGTAVGPLGVNITDTGLTFDSAGNLWMSTDAPAPSSFYSLDPSTGAATLVGAQGQQVTGLAADGTTIVGLGGDDTNNLVTIDPATGAATEIGPLVNVDLSDGGIDFDGAGVLWGLDDEENIFTIDPATGTATVVASTLDDFEGLAIAEPLTATATPTEIQPGVATDVFVTGAGCYEAGASITLTSGGTPLAEEIVAPTTLGAFEGTVTVPADVDPSAPLAIEVVCDDDQSVVLALAFPQQATTTTSTTTTSTTTTSTTTLAPPPAAPQPVPAQPTFAG